MRDFRTKKTRVNTNSQKTLKNCLISKGKYCNKCRVHSVFRFLVKMTKNEKIAVPFVYFLYKKSAFCLKIIADFFHFWSLNKTQKME